MPEPTEQPGRLEGAGRAHHGAREVPARPAGPGVEGLRGEAAAAPSPPVTGDGAAPQALSGQDWRDRVKAARSALAKQQRTGRGKYAPRHVKGAQRGPAGPGMVRRVQPPEGGSS